jgi:hypothetical protein
VTIQLATFFNGGVGDFLKKREILEFAINKEGSSDNKNTNIGRFL